MLDPNFAMLVVDTGRNGYTASTLLSYISFQTQPFILFLTHAPGTGPGLNFGASSFASIEVHYLKEEIVPSFSLLGAV